MDLKKLSIPQHDSQSISVEFELLLSPVSLFISLDEKLIVGNVRYQLRISQFGFNCKFLRHHHVPADLEMPVGYPEFGDGVFCMNVFVRPGM